MNITNEDFWDAYARAEAVMDELFPESMGHVRAEHVPLLIRELAYQLGLGYEPS